MVNSLIFELEFDVKLIYYLRVVEVHDLLSVLC